MSTLAISVGFGDGVYYTDAIEKETGVGWEIEAVNGSVYTVSTEAENSLLFSFSLIPHNLPSCADGRDAIRQV